MPHNLFESVSITSIPNAAGTIINTTADGTTGGTVLANAYEYNALIYAGTLAQTGTMFVYALGGGGTTVLGSVIVTATSGGNAIFEVKSDTLVNKGTQYNALGALIKVDSGGTWRGGAFWLQRQARTAGTSDASAAGWAYVGTSLY